MNRDMETLLMEALAIVQTSADAAEQDYIGTALTVAADKIETVLQAADNFTDTSEL